MTLTDEAVTAAAESFAQTAGGNPDMRRRHAERALAAAALFMQARPGRDRHYAEIHGLRTALVAMRIASALPGVADEYDFGPAITEVTTLLQPPSTDEAVTLAPCPFCGRDLTRGSRRINPHARCTTADCYGAKMPVVNLDVPDSVSAWNTRAAPFMPALPAQVPDGWQIVPQECSMEMSEALHREINDPVMPTIGLGLATARKAYRAMLAAAPPAPAAQAEFQKRVLEWMMACFSMEICRDGTERNHRFLEEAIELVQSLGCTRSEAHQLVDYTFDRPAGEPQQELGGVMVTIAALCFPNDLDMNAAAEIELARVWNKIDTIRAKQAAKPKHSPLPAPPAPVSAEQSGA